MEENTTYHIPALLDETINGLAIKPDGVYVDATFGGGGHSRAIVGKLGENGKLFGFDQDMDAYGNRIDDKRFTFVHGNFRFIKNFLRYYGEASVDGILADLGVSFHHFDDSSRGFSFRFGEGVLDMRMNRDNSTDAKKVINTYGPEELIRIFKLYGDLKNAKKITDRIVKRRAEKEIVTTGDLLDTVRPIVNPKQEKKELAQIFQALRMEVNREVDALAEFLAQTTQLLKPGGRLAVITYHSVEDRMVKNFIRSGNIEGKTETDFFGRTQSPLRAVNNKVIVPSDEEVERNPRSRSAKLRIAERIKTDGEN
ncbi:MAG TPA: 16S rRNA (cytosine(1402)-N(4))-methyltransferase RsmH [Candidatus Limisoma gallistercoris]|nr:16S rRNA (cytosine(1402)-N(4))-methyltransferase RsmH [Candidatus Limisoma gallistercoris]